MSAILAFYDAGGRLSTDLLRTFGRAVALDGACGPTVTDVRKGTSCPVGWLLRHTPIETLSPNARVHKKGCRLLSERGASGGLSTAPADRLSSGFRSVGTKVTILDRARIDYIAGMDRVLLAVSLASSAPLFAQTQLLSTDYNSLVTDFTTSRTVVKVQTKEKLQVETTLYRAPIAYSTRNDRTVRKQKRVVGFVNLDGGDKVFRLDDAPLSRVGFGGGIRAAVVPDTVFERISTLKKKKFGYLLIDALSFSFEARGLRRNVITDSLRDEARLYPRFTFGAQYFGFPKDFLEEDRWSVAFPAEVKFGYGTNVESLDVYYAGTQTFGSQTVGVGKTPDGVIGPEADRWAASATMAVLFYDPSKRFVIGPYTTHRRMEGEPYRPGIGATAAVLAKPLSYGAFSLPSAIGFSIEYDARDGEVAFFFSGSVTID